MVKRNILAVIVPALLVAGATNATEVYSKDGNKVDLYGKTAGLHYFSKGNGENSYNGNGDMTYAHLDSKGETQINSDLTSYDQWEHNFQGNDSEGIDAQTGDKTRPAFAGLEYADVGSFNYDRNYGVIYGALGYTDMLPEFGGDIACSDDSFVGRVDNVATYRNSSFFGLVDGLNFVIQHLGKNKRDTTHRSNGGGVGGSINCKYEGFGIVGAYGAADHINLREARPLGDSKKTEQWVTGLKYDANNLYPATNYGETRNVTPITNKFTNTSGSANKAQGVLLVMQYQFDFGLCPPTAYTKSKMRGVEGIGDVDLVNYFEMGAAYYFNKNMSTYVDYITSQIDSDNELGVGSDDTITVDIVYQF